MRKLARFCSADQVRKLVKDIVRSRFLPHVADFTDHLYGTGSTAQYAKGMRDALRSFGQGAQKMVAQVVRSRIADGLLEMPKVLFDVHGRTRHGGSMIISHVVLQMGKNLKRQHQKATREASDVANELTVVLDKVKTLLRFQRGDLHTLAFWAGVEEKDRGTKLAEEFERRKLAAASRKRALPKPKGGEEHGA